MGDLDASPPCQVSVEVELLLELKDLVTRVRGSLTLWLHSGLERIDAAWKQNRRIYFSDLSLLHLWHNFEIIGPKIILNFWPHVSLSIRTYLEIGVVNNNFMN